MNHARLTMVTIGLAAVGPDGFGIIDGDCKGCRSGDIFGVIRGKAREETSFQIHARF